MGYTPGTCAKPLMRPRCFRFARLAQEAEGASGRLNKELTGEHGRAALEQLFYIRTLANVAF